MASITDSDITKHLRKIITKNSLVTITPREIRSSLEKALDLEEGALDDERYRIRQLSQTVFAEVTKEERQKDEDDDKPLNTTSTKSAPAPKVQKRKKDEDEEAPKKNAKTIQKGGTNKKTQDEFSVQIASGSNPIYCKISVFKGNTMIDIRKYYTDKLGEEKPTQKGISMTREQWQALQAVMPDVEEALNGFP